MNDAVPCESERISTAYRVSSSSGTSAVICVRPLPIGSLPDTLPRRPERSLITAPTYSSETRTRMWSTGSSREIEAAAAASLSARPPACWKAMSEESTE